MTKRLATSVLTHDNWDQEEPEDSDHQQGITFANKSELTKRVIKTARRRLINTLSSENGESSSHKSGIFSSFTGFQKSSSCADATPKINENITGKQLFKETLPSIPASASEGLEVKNLPKESQQSYTPRCLANGSADVTTRTVDDDEKKCNNDSYEEMDKKFCKNLKALNEGVYAWIGRHLKQNPFVNLMPVFRDYESHFKNLETKFNRVVATSSAQITTDSVVVSSDGFVTEKQKEEEEEDTSNLNDQASSVVVKKDANVFGCSDVNVKNGNISTGPSSTLTFNECSSIFNASSSFKPSSFNFLTASSIEKKKNDDNDDDDDVKREKSTIHSAATPFSFSFGQSSGGFSFNAQPSAESSKESNVSNADGPFKLCFKEKSSNELVDGERDGADDEDKPYEPPKPQFNVVEEEGAYYSIKCKLFYKSGVKYEDKGVGTLHLKKLDSNKAQLLIRADTSLGNVLLNVALVDSLPCSRNGKNNISLVCVPNPPLVSKNDNFDPSAPIGFLIRVKTAEEADKLFTELEKAKKTGN